MTMVDEHNPHGIGRINPLLLKQLGQQWVDAQRPRVMAGCDVTANGDTVTVTAGLVLAVGRYLTRTEPATFTVSTRWPLSRLDAIVATDHDTTATVEFVMGRPGWLMPPKLADGAQLLAWVMVRGDTATIYTSQAALDTALARIARAERDQVVHRRRRQRACPHPDQYEDTTHEDPHRTFVCPDCGNVEKRPRPVRHMARQFHRGDLPAAPTEGIQRAHRKPVSPRTERYLESMRRHIDKEVLRLNREIARLHGPINKETRT